MIFLLIFSFIYKNCLEIQQPNSTKKQRKSIQKRHMNDIKVFLMKKKKGHKRHKKLNEDEKQRLVEYRKIILKSRKTLHGNRVI